MWNSRLWKQQLALEYQSGCDAIFYPGVDWADEFGLKLRKLSGRRVPVIATIEGIIADGKSLERVAAAAGHQVYAQPGTEWAFPRIRWIYENSDQIVAISPFLMRAAECMYAKKVSYLPLGVDREIFHARGKQEPARCRVLGCGTVKSSKNLEAFVQVAARYTDADFVWYGDGPMVEPLTAEAHRRGLKNLGFPGSLPPVSLAEEFRKSSLFVVPSRAEGVPKVTQEAAACGLPIVLYGFYEAPSVVHQRNGLVAWSDEEFSEQVGTLIRDPDTRARMGQEGSRMAEEWDWDRIAPRWEKLIVEVAAGKSS
jgi:glycosyltransferase involved in cell wall biosynthesis